MRNKPLLKKLFKRKVNRGVGTTAFLFVVLLIVGCFMFFPFVLVIGNSFKPLTELWIFPPKLLPMDPTFENYKQMFTIMSTSWVPFTRYVFNSVMITTLGTAGHVILASMAAFVLAKKKLPGGRLIFTIIQTALMFNGTVLAIPNYMIMIKLGWVDTYWALIIPAFGAPLGLFLMKQFMESSIPDTLLEAARIDGAKQGRIFWHIAMPLVKPAWLTLILFSVQSLWNMGSTTYIFKEELKTLPYALGQILSGGLARAGVGAAVSVTLLIVPIGVFIITQSNIIETMSSSGIKE